MYCRKKGYKEIELQVKKLEMSPPNSLQGSFYSEFFPFSDASGLSYNSSFLTASNTNSFNFKQGEFGYPNMPVNERWSKVAAEIDGNKNFSVGDDTLMKMKSEGKKESNKSQSFTGSSSLLNETEEERARRKEKSKAAWLEKYGQSKKIQE